MDAKGKKISNVEHGISKVEGSNEKATRFPHSHYRIVAPPTGDTPLQNYWRNLRNAGENRKNGAEFCIHSEIFDPLQKSGQGSGNRSQGTGREAGEARSRGEGEKKSCYRTENTVSSLRLPPVWRYPGTKVGRKFGYSSGKSQKRVGIMSTLRDFSVWTKVRRCDFDGGRSILI